MGNGRASRLAALALAALAAASNAAAAVRETPALTHVARLDAQAPSLTAGAAFLNDGAAQNWLLEARPEAYSALVERALRVDDLRQTLTGLDSQRSLREALLMRQDVPEARPQALQAILARNQGLQRRRGTIERATLEWSALPEAIRGRSAAEGGFDAGSWTALGLVDRLKAARHYAREEASALTRRARDAHEYVAAYQQGLRLLGPLLDDAELDDHAKRFEAAQRAAAALESARAAGQALGSSRGGEADAAIPADGGLARVAAAATMRQAERRLPLTAVEHARLIQRLRAALWAELRGAPAGEEVAAFMAQRGFALAVEPIPGRPVAQFDFQTDRVVIDERSLLDAAEALGHEPRALLSHAGALREVAIALSSILVHEATHHRQLAWALDKGLDRQDALRAYSQQWEIEAFYAQAAFLEAKRRRDPVFGAVVARMEGLKALNDLLPWRDVVADPDAFHAQIRESYRRVATVQGSAARLLRRYLGQRERYAPAVRAIEAELARRRRSGARDRFFAERGGDTEVRSLSIEGLNRVATSTLRRLKRRLDRPADEMARVMSALIQRSHDELARLRAQLADARKS